MMATLESLRALEQEEQEIIAERERNEQRRAAVREREARGAGADRLQQYLADTITHGNRAVQLQLDQREAAAWLRRLDILNRDFVNASAMRLVSFWLWFLTTPAAYVIDCLMFAPYARHLAQSAFPRLPAFVFVMSFVIPLVLLLLENVIAHRLTEARQRFGQMNTHTFFTWATAVLATIVMPALIAVTQWAMQPASLSARLLIMHRFQMLAMILIALFSHGLVVFSGQRGLQAKAFVLFKLQQYIRRRRSHNLERAYRVERRAMGNSYTNYRQGLDAHNAEYPDAPIEHGQVDRTTAEQLNGWFGYEVVILAGQQGTGPAQGFTPQVPDGQPDPAATNPAPNPLPASGQQAQAPPAATTPPTQERGVEEYYQNILSYRQSEEDSEVRV